MDHSLCSSLLLTGITSRCRQADFVQPSLYLITYDGIWKKSVIQFHNFERKYFLLTYKLGYWLFAIIDIINDAGDHCIHSASYFLFWLQVTEQSNLMSSWWWCRKGWKIQTRKRSCGKPFECLTGRLCIAIQVKSKTNLPNFCKVK